MVVARYHQHTPGIGRRISLAELQERCTRVISHEMCYQQFRQLGFSYGPTFQTIQELRLGDDEAISRVHLPAAVLAELKDYHLHPIVLDTCFQMLLTLAGSGAAGNAIGSFLPVGVRRVRVHGPVLERMWCHVQLTEQNVQTMAANILLFSEEGTVLVEVQEFRVQSLENADATSSASQAIGSWLYELQWQMQPREPQEESSTITQRTWVIFADQCGVGQQLAAHLNQYGQQTVLVFAGNTYQEGAGCYTLRPNRPEDYHSLFAGVTEERATPLRGIVHLWSLDVTADQPINHTSLGSIEEREMLSILHMVQVLEQTEHTPRLWLVTQGAQSLKDERNLPAVAQAPMWGLGRVLHQESLSLHTTLIDLDYTITPDLIRALFTEIWQPDQEDQLLFRAGERYVARLNRMETPDRTLPPYFRSDCSYLLTGGLGALGMLVARWMVQHGARRLILMGRSNLPARSQWYKLPENHPHRQQIAFIHELEAMGASIHLASIDVTRQEELARFLDNYRREGWPPIRGVIHSAGIVRDQILLRMDPDTFTSVLRPKMLGGWTLHECFKDTSLDFFVLFSSISSLVVTSGQCNYAAGNAFLDALAHYRRMQGLPAISINWGPWDIGMIAQLHLQDLYLRRGIEIIAPEHGMNILAHLLSDNPAQAAVISAHWPTVIESYPIVPRLIEHLGQSQSDEAESSSEKADESLPQQIRRAHGEERMSLLENYLKQTVARVLRIEQARLDSEISINALGLDSMMAVELKSRIEQGLGKGPSVVELLQGASIGQLARKLAEQLQQDEKEAAGQAEATSENLEQLLEHVDEFTLNQMLQQLEQVSPADGQDMVKQEGSIA